MLTYARKVNLPVIWNTNAVLLNDGFVQRVSELELREVIVGMDAFSKNTYDKVRIGGDFEKAVENTKKLLDDRRPNTRITVQFITQAANEHEKDDFKEFWLSQGAVVKIRPRLGWGDGVDAQDLVLEQDDRLGPCPWIIRTVSIHWNGMVVQCDGDWDQKSVVGDMRVQTLKEIWDGELAERRRRHRNGDFDFEPCKNCNDWQAGLSEFYYPE